MNSRISSLAEFVRSQLAHLHMSQAELAVSADLSPSDINGIVQGRIKLPGPEKRRRLAKALNVRHIDLLVAAGELTEDEIDDVAPMVANDPDVDLIAESWEFLDRTRRQSVLDVVRTFAESSPRYLAEPVDLDKRRERQEQ